MKFYDRIGEAVDKIEVNPEGYQVVYKGLRRVGLRQFDDWFLWFQQRPDKSLVISCLSGRRNPRLVKERAVIPFPEP